ncbi:MAG: hypothetical protein E7253_07720 [Lachnospiraceae bacterium]|nr:hypothetical protein [Lachnospiraceae bacterium]
MEAVFLKIVNMSITATYMVMAVLFFRLIFKKAPKWIFCLLWSFVAVRLVCPFSFESGISLVPSAQPLPDEIIYTAEPQIDSGIDSVDQFVNPILEESFKTDDFASANKTQIWSFIFSQIWILGMAVLFSYAAGSYFLLKTKMGTATIYRGREERGTALIKQSERVDSPFVLGFIRPVIYLPYEMEEQDLNYVLAHEMAHIRRKDHWWKPIGFLLLIVYWFNPFMWIAYLFLCRDIEAACDEKVIKEMEKEERQGYSTALLHCSVHRKTLMACPLAFGEVGVKERITTVMNYKKPAWKLVLLAAFVSLFIAVCLITNPEIKDTEVMGAEYLVTKLIYAEDSPESDSFKKLGGCTITTNHHLVLAPAGEDGKMQWDDLIYVGQMKPYELTNEELEGYVYHESLNLGKITDAYIISGKEENDIFYLAFQTKKGKTYLAKGWEDVSERGQDGSDDTRILAICQLESGLKEEVNPLGFFNLTLLTETGHNIEVFESVKADGFPDYKVVGFAADSAPYSMADIGFAGYKHTSMTDMGYAVFRMSKDNRYKLIDYHIYENAAIENEKIYYCEHPAVLNEAGELKPKETFDVVLSCNTELAKIQRVYSYEKKAWQKEGKEELLSKAVEKSPSITLFSWEKEEGVESVSQIYIAKGGYQILDMGVKDEFSKKFFGKQLTLNDVISLSGKGMELSWEDFDEYSCYVTGSGLYIQLYEIDDEYRLLIGGNYPYQSEGKETDESEKPMYIYLQHINKEENIDIRTENVEAFLKETRMDPLDKAIRSAILANHMHTTYEPENSYYSVDFILLGKKEVSGTALKGTAGHKNSLSCYGIACYQVYEVDEYACTYEPVSGSHVPVVMTFDAEEDSYTLTDYWEPGNDKKFEEYIREAFPPKWAEEALNLSKYEEEQGKRCEEQLLLKYSGYEKIEPNGSGGS